MTRRSKESLRQAFTTCSRQINKSVKQLLYKLENNDNELERNLSTMLQSVRGTKQFWQLRRSEVNAMIRDFGSPTLFLTFSCAEYNSADISESLKLANGLPRDTFLSYAPRTLRLSPDVQFKVPCIPSDGPDQRGGVG